MADIAIIDASDMCRELLGVALENQGYCTVRSCPEKAVQSIRQAASCLIILDPGPFERQRVVAAAKNARLCRRNRRRAAGDTYQRPVR